MLGASSNNNIFGWGGFGSWPSANENNNSTHRGFNGNRNLRYRDFSPNPVSGSVLDPPAMWMKPQSMLRQCDIMQEGLNHGLNHPAERNLPVLQEINQNVNNNNTTPQKAKANGKLTLRLRPETQHNRHSLGTHRDSLEVDTQRRKNYVEIPIIRISSKDEANRPHKSAAPELITVCEDDLSDYENLDDSSSSVPIDRFNSVKLQDSPQRIRTASHHPSYSKTRIAPSKFKSTVPVIQQGIPVAQESPRFFSNSVTPRENRATRDTHKFDFCAEAFDYADDNDVVLVGIDKSTKEPYFKNHAVQGQSQRWLEESDFVMLDDEPGPHVTKIDLTEENSQHRSQAKFQIASPIVIDEESMSEQSKLFSNSASNRESDIMVLAETKGEVQRHKPRYFQQIEEDIISSDMLSDEAINLGQNLLHKQYPDVGGLEDTSLGAVYNFSQCRNGKFVQVLHDLSCHWVLVSNIGCKPGEVNLYDTLYYGIIKPAILKQITCIMKPKGKYLRVNVQPIQKQQNSTDCGVFALAFATSLLAGQDPTKLVYDIAQLRPYLMHCLEKGKMMSFPTLCEEGDKTLLKLVERIPPSSVKVALVCSCRVPFDAKDKTDDLVACRSCGILYHINCENIPLEALEIDIKWRCSSCRHSG